MCDNLVPMSDKRIQPVREDKTNAAKASDDQFTLTDYTSNLLMH